MNLQTEQKIISPEEQKRVLQTYIQKVITQNGMNSNDKSLEIHAIVDANGGDEGSRSARSLPPAAARMLSRRSGKSVPRTLF